MLEARKLEREGSQGANTGSHARSVRRPARTWLGKLWRRALLGALTLYLILVPTGCATGWLILGENHAVIDPMGATQKMLRIDGREVECWIARSPGAKLHEPVAYSLLFTGKGDRVDRWITMVADAWGDKPVEVWGMNYPGSGGSDGPVKLRWVAPAALAVFDRLHEVAGKRPIFLQGASFGTTAVLCVAARRDVAGLIVQNPAPLRQLIMGHYGWWNLWLLAWPVSRQIPDDLDAVTNGAKSGAPCVFILSDGDSIIPPAYHQLVVDAYKGPQRVIRMPGASHDAGLSHDAVESLTTDRDWLWKGAGLR
jgi:hypothetical protein